VAQQLVHRSHLFLHLFNRLASVPRPALVGD
jgi:hypothetical protein